MDENKKNELLSALNSIPVSQLSYGEWLNVGMALWHEGFGPEV